MYKKQAFEANSEKDEGSRLYKWTGVPPIWLLINYKPVFALSFRKFRVLFFTLACNKMIPSPILLFIGLFGRN
jgi:hypothetical protein